MNIWPVLAAGQKNGDSPDFQWGGGSGNIAVGGTFEDSTARLKFSPDGGTNWFYAGTSTEFTSKGSAKFELGPCLLRLEVVDGTGNESLDAWVTCYRAR